MQPDENNYIYIDIYIYIYIKSTIVKLINKNISQFMKILCYAKLNKNVREMLLQKQLQSQNDAFLQCCIMQSSRISSSCPFCIRNNYLIVL